MDISGFLIPITTFAGINSYKQLRLCVSSEIGDQILVNFPESYSIAVHDDIFFSTGNAVYMSLPIVRKMFFTKSMMDLGRLF